VTLAQLHAVLTNAIFTGLRFEVEQASRGLSAIAELLVILDYCTVLLPYTYKALLVEMCRIGDFKRVGHLGYILG